MSTKQSWFSDEVRKEVEVCIAESVNERKRILNAQLLCRDHNSSFLAI